jgi:anti-sigma factor RsiW
MSKHFDDRWWMACLDGQLSAAEAAAFDRTLQQADRERISREIRLEQALGECLGAGPGCPDALWKRTELLLRKQGAAQPRRRSPRYWPWGFGIAAAITLILGFLFMPSLQPPATYLAMEASSVAALAQLSSVPGTPDAVNTFLTEHGVPLQVVDFKVARPASRHGVTLLGAREHVVEGEPILELLYDCCGRPAKVVVAPQDSAAANRILEAENDMETQLAWYGHDHSPAAGAYETGMMGVQETRAIGTYLTGIISVHPTDGLLETLVPRSGALARRV